jgi:hypothetical protein
MSSEKSTDETIISTAENCNENERPNSVSEGEIIDDDEAEELKCNNNPIINVPVRRIQKNFRARHSDNESDDTEETGNVVANTTKSGKRRTFTNEIRRNLEKVAYIYI